jgi:sulfatase modifying factor 1
MSTSIIRGRVFMCAGRELEGVSAAVLMLVCRVRLFRTFLFAIFLAGLMVFSPKSTIAAHSLPENFVLIRGGEFVMGSPESEPDHDFDETQHPVWVSDFSICRYAVTVAEFRKFIEATGYQTDAEKDGFSAFVSRGEVKVGDGINWRFGVSGSVRPPSEENHPVLHVSWNDAVAYCQWLSKITGQQFRLPTEAEREYACRAGTTTPFNTGENLITAQANFNGNNPDNNNQEEVFRHNTVPVNSFSPNSWGLYNMHGNVWEWCSDWYGSNCYDECKASGMVTNPAGMATGSNRVLRGGSWRTHALLCRSAHRNAYSPSYRHVYIGFRLVHPVK